MPQTLAFDVYGTLIDTDGVYQSLTSMIPDRADTFMKTWRQKQLEYSFRRGLMKKYTDFSICTRDALHYSCRALDVSLTEDQKQTLLDGYTKLPAFEDVHSCLTDCRDAGHTIYAFSNGSEAAVSLLLQQADIASLFDGIVSAESVKMFKPSPDVYNYFIKHTGAKTTHTWLISGNSFDVIGACACRWNGAWVQRSPRDIYDTWDDFMPTVTLEGLKNLSSHLYYS